MGDVNPIRTLGDYSKPSHEGYRNTFELLVGNNVVPLRSDTIRLVQNGCSFHGLRSEDPNQHLKDFLKLVDSLDLDGSITTWEDLTTRFLAQFFPPGRTAKLRNDIMMFQQHHGESLSEAWTCFKDLLQKCEIDRVAGGKLCNKNTNESWEIIKNLALSDHEGWDETKEFVKPVKAIATHQGIPKTPDRRLLELEDLINFLLKGSRPTPTSSSTHTPQAYVKVVYPNSGPRNQNEPPKLNPFTFHECTCPTPQPQALGTTFEARIRDYMAAHTERMERFENFIFKQREEINGRMTEMFGLLKELTTSTKKRSDKTEVTSDNIEKPTETEAKIPVKEAETKNGAENRAENKPIKTPENEDAVEAPGSRPVAYYLKHKINEKLIEGLVDNNRFNNSPSRTRVGKKKGMTYKVLPRGPVYDAILKKKITKKEDIGGNFEIPYSIGGLKHVNALIDQGSNVNAMPYSTYMKLTDERPAETNIRLSLASHLYIYPLGIVEDVLVEVAENIYLVDFVIINIKENEKRPFILGMMFLTTAKAVIKFDTGTITLRSGNSKISFNRIPEPLCETEKVKNDIEPITFTMVVNRLVLEWEERIKLHQEKEMKLYR
ncbi:zinc finger, CCHC-type containing protein [Tanacetum coccineum]